MIKVYFETEGYADMVATFKTSKLYMACLSTLEKEAKAEGFTKVTETETEE